MEAEFCDGMFSEYNCMNVCVQSSSALAPGGQGWRGGWGSGQPLIRMSSDGNHMPFVDKIKGQREREREGYRTH